MHETLIFVFWYWIAFLGRECVCILYEINEKYYTINFRTFFSTHSFISLMWWSVFPFFDNIWESWHLQNKRWFFVKTGSSPRLLTNRSCNASALSYYRPKKSSEVGLTNEANNVARFSLPIVHRPEISDAFQPKYERLHSHLLSKIYLRKTPNRGS